MATSITRKNILNKFQSCATVKKVEEATNWVKVSEVYIKIPSFHAGQRKVLRYHSSKNLDKGDC